MANRTIYPIEAPTPPHWRGVSDLAGYVGDLFYGAYDRSTNFQVHNATSVAKRRGFVRALNEKFPGHPAGAFCREKGRPVQVMADGVGIKILASVPPITGGENPFDSGDAGFPADTFDRADGANVTYPATGDVWDEDHGVEPYGNEASWQGTDNNEIKDREWHISPSGSPSESTLYTGYIDKDTGAKEPTSNYVIRAEIDLSNVFVGTGAKSLAYNYGKGSGPGSAGNEVEHSHFFCMGIGLPGRFKNQLTSKNGAFGYGALNAATFHNGEMNKANPWSGVICMVQFRQEEEAGTADTGLMRFAMRLHAFACVCDFPEGHNQAIGTDRAVKGACHNADAFDSASPWGGDNQGYVALDGVYEIKDISMAQLQSIHTVEFGRIAIEGGFFSRARLWTGKTIAGVTGSTTPDLDMSAEHYWNQEVADSEGTSAYIVRPSEIWGDGKHNIQTFAGLGAGWLSPSATVGSADPAHGIRCRETQVHNNFL